jgi:uncharacterized membrane protein YphA (DoxX/SURF4 family)
MFKLRAGPDLASLLLRFCLAVIFLSSGGLKISYGSTRWSSEVELSPFVQAAVAWGELACGLACLFGVLTQIAAAGIIVIMFGAVILLTGKELTQMERSRGPAATDRRMEGLGRFLPGYEYNVAIIAMAGALILLGSGPFSIDAALWRRRNSPSQGVKAGVQVLVPEAPAGAPPPPSPSPV